MYDDLLRDTLNTGYKLYYDLLGYTLLNTYNEIVLSSEHNLFIPLFRRVEMLIKGENKSIHFEYNNNVWWFESIR